jgi:hypothetical protein
MVGTLLLLQQQLSSPPPRERFSHQVVRLRRDPLHVLVALRDWASSVFKPLHPAVHVAARHHLQTHASV